MKKSYHRKLMWREFFTKKTIRIMKLYAIIAFMTLGELMATDVLTQNISLNIKDQPLSQAIAKIEQLTEYHVFYNSKLVDLSQRITVEIRNASLEEALDLLFANKEIDYLLVKNLIVLFRKGDPDAEKWIKTIVEAEPVPDKSISINRVVSPLKSANITLRPTRPILSGIVTDESGEPLIGVNILVKGTNRGTSTDIEGRFTLDEVDEQAVLVVSYIGYQSQEIKVGGRTEIEIMLVEDSQTLDEVVVVGYGTQKMSDLTGSVVRADIDAMAESPNTSIIENLRGNVAGLIIGQITAAGQEPNLSIRGQSTLAGSNAPLIVVDGVVFRGNLNAINPSDIASVDILKDASAAAVYGSQAANGVVLLTTKKGTGIQGNPVISYSGDYSFQSPVKELIPPGPQGFYDQTEASIIYQSRTEESGYTEPNPDWQITNIFSVNAEGEAFNEGRTTNWYDVLTNENMYIQNHNLSLSNSTESTDYYVSLGYNDQAGYLKNEKYDRLSGRINLSNRTLDWLEIGIQSFVSLSDYSGATGNPSDRYIEPYATDKDGSGVRYPTVLAGQINPFFQFERDDLNKHLNLFGNLYAKIDIPFIKGLSYKINFANNYRSTKQYQFRSYAVDFQGEGSKEVIFNNNLSMDNIVAFNRNFNDRHNVQLTLLYGFEKQQQDNTLAIGQNYVNKILSYNRLQAASSEQQQSISGAWEESSLYSMVRLFYGYKYKYLFTGTIRRDGFSGFGTANKFGVFPSISFAWNVAEEAFFGDNINWLDQLKLRASYGSVGNRTIGRYQTLAIVGGGFNFIDMSGNPLYTQSITSLESPNLKWEQTTGINLGIDFGVKNQRILGTIDYYNNNTTNLFYRVDIPAISRYSKFPDNLGKLHNNGLELSLTTQNINRNQFHWNTSFNFSRNRNELVELLGFDQDNDGEEDDLISEGLFIGESIDAIYDYEIDGKWQLNDEIPSGFDVGAHKPVDQNGDGIINPLDDRKIIGYSTPAYTFGMNNSFKYRNWTFKFFIYSMQGGKNHYLGRDNYLDYNFQNSELHFRYIFPESVDFWKPETPNARYQRPNIVTATETRGSLYGDRSFIRLQNVSLIYELPDLLFGEKGFRSASLYVNAKNLLTLTKWNGWDPETNQTITRDGLPVLKSYSIGINIEI